MRTRADIPSAVVAQRLRCLADLVDAQREAARATGEMRRAAQAARRAAIVALSPSAVDRRLRELSDLHRLCRSLAAAASRHDDP